ncbi:hypothetical protein ACFW9I_35965, partial [[Kitasatospora] papulosa]|uniref:hypothetical protein n=1 Tax=[Kitasatospora] papulosa TaxID=1464011 RepID=UPI0036CAA65B
MLAAQQAFNADVRRAQQQVAQLPLEQQQRAAQVLAAQRAQQAQASNPQGAVAAAAPFSSSIPMSVPAVSSSAAARVHPAARAYGDEL